jgi:hypothetical protein
MRVDPRYKEQQKVEAMTPCDGRKPSSPMQAPLYFA